MHILRSFATIIKHKNVRHLSVKGSVIEATKGKHSGLDLRANDTEERPLSPLYTQRVGMFIKPGIFFREYRHKHFIVGKLYVFAILSFTIIWLMIKIVPPGHVGIIVRKNGEIDQFNNTGRLALFYIPFLETPIAFRTTPIRKKIIRKCRTADSKIVEAVVFLTMEAKLAYASHIYSIFGVNYTNDFVEKELCFDIDKVVEKYKMEELMVDTDKVESLLNHGKGEVFAIIKDSPLERADSEIKERFEDAGAFNKIIISDISVSFRNPDALEPSS